MENKKQLGYYYCNNGRHMYIYSINPNLFKYINKDGIVHESVLHSHNYCFYFGSIFTL